MKRKNSSEIANPTVEEGGSSKSNDEKMDLNNSADSSNDSLYEIRLNEFVRKDEISDFDLRALVVRCSACGRQINHHSEKDVKKHRKLQVITCKECYEFYGSSEFSQDESGMANYCTWCGNGGKLIVCDYCPNGFCSACIRRNFGRSEISETTKEGWKCYVCNKKRLKPKMKFCDLIMSFKNKQKDKKKEKKSQPTSTGDTSNKSISETWLQSAFDESEVACKVFCKKMAKLRTIGVGKKKSLKHVVKKMEDLIKDHKIALKRIVESTNQGYAEHLERQQQAIVTVDISNENENSQNSDCIIEEVQDDNNDKNVKKQNHVKDMEVDNDDKNDNSVKDIDSDKSKAERLRAKLKLLQSSSDSESNSERKSPEKLVPDTNLKTNGKVDDADSSVIEIGDTPDKKDDDSDKSASKAKRKINFNFSDISNSDLESDSKPDVGKLVEEIEKQVESSDHEDDPMEDIKLKQVPKVDMGMRCDHLLKDGETTLVLSEDSDMEKKLDKLVDSLCKFPRNTRTSRVPKAKRRSGPFKSRASVKQQLLASSSSIDSLSSEEDEDQKKIQLTKKSPVKGKVKLPAKSDDGSTSSSIDLGSDSEDDKKKKKKGAKGKKKKEESDSSDDFVPAKKVRKYDPLLHGPSLSDDDEDEEGGKKKKKPGRKRKVLSSDDEKKSPKTSGTSSSEESDKGKKKKKRKRIKKIDGSSSDEDNDKEKDKGDTPGKGRKNIRKILSKEKVAMTTKEAQAEEKERKRRIAERQKLYNKCEETVREGNEIITRKMVLDVDPESKEEVVEIHPDLVKKLKPHQVNGVKFMWECTIESIKDLDKPGSGCILAHCMGLGKTLQVIAFLHTCLTNKIVGKVITRAMIICPYNTALNWGNEFDYWLEDVEGDIKVHQLATVKTNLERLDILKYWFEEGGVIILSYDMFRRLAADKIPKLKKKEKEQLAECLLDPGPDIVVCDEGHVLKNEKSAVSLATNKLATMRRIILTGTPLQNNLKEYHCMVSFVKPNLLGTSKEFFNRFVNPITNGQYEDSSEYDVRLMKRRIHILHKLLDGCVQRCDYSALTKFLPPKHEFVISVKLSDIQAKMYECYLEKLSTAKQGSKIQGRTLFADFNNLRNIWTHPYICHTSHERSEFRRFLKDEGDDDEEFINDGEITESESSFSSSEEVIGSGKDEDDKVENGSKIYKTRSRGKTQSDEEEQEEKDQPENKQWYHEFISEADKYNIEISGKIVILLEILKECERIGDKVLLFSQSLLSLDLIEELLSYSETHFSNSKSEKDDDKDVLGSWCKGLDYFRMDGTTSVDFRKSYIDMFNDPSNTRSRLFLISTRAGSLGTNLVGANRVIIFDTSWNPSHDVQAIFRVYRFGQIKPVYIYRLLAQGTMEEKIYDRQVTKISLSYRVVDEQQIDRHFSAADLAELYSFDRNSTKQRPTPMVPKDRLLAELLIRNKEWIVTYHEHDSLLQSETETDLTEEERQAAWAEYENEKEGRATQSFGDANSVDDNFDTSSMTREPDFSGDYDGKMIPNLTTIVSHLFEKLKKQGVDGNPLEFKKRLLSSIYAVRQAFQEKHVKVLRMKQDFCTRGTVPPAVNKYMEELTQILKATGDYITRLSGAITSEQTKIHRMQQQLFNQPRAQANYSFRVPNMGTGRGVNPGVFINTSTPINVNQMNALQRAAFNQYMENMKAKLAAQQRAQFAANAAPAGTTSNSTTSDDTGVVIEEVDDVTPTENNDENKTSATSTIISAPSTSTVTIKEVT